MTTIRVHATSPRPGHILGGTVEYFIRELLVSMVFFTRATLDPERLQGALAQALTTHPLFAGAVFLQEHRVHIELNDQGVPFSVVDLPGTLDQLYARDPSTYGTLVDQLHGARTLRRRSPVLTARLNRFSCGASALGVCWHHALGDLASFMSLLGSWTRAFAGQPPLEPVLAPDRDAYLLERLPPGGAREPMIRKPSTGELLRVVWAILRAKSTQEIVYLHFTEDETQRMQRAFSEAAAAPITVGDAVAAHVMAELLHIDPAQGARVLGIVVNVRRRVGIPDDVIGNFVCGMLVDCAAGARAPEIASGIRRNLGRFVDDHLDFHATRAFVERSGGPRPVRLCIPRYFDLARHNMFMTNWSRHGLYDTFFGEARPELVLPIAGAPVPFLGVIAEGLSGQGRLVGLALPRPLVARLRRETKLLHGHRDPAEPVPPAARHMGWLR